MRKVILSLAVIAAIGFTKNIQFGFSIRLIPIMT